MSSNLDAWHAKILHEYIRGHISNPLFKGQHLQIIRALDTKSLNKNFIFISYSLSYRKQQKLNIYYIVLIICHEKTKIYQSNFSG